MSTRVIPLVIRHHTHLNKLQLSTAVHKGLIPKSGLIAVTRDNNMHKRGANRSYSDMCRDRNRLRVLLDMDMVLADFEGHFISKYRETYPDEPYVKKEDRRGFWLRDQYQKLKPGLEDKVCSIYESQYFFRDLPELPGAVEAAKEIRNMEDVDVFICTSPLTKYKYCATEKFEWVENHLGAEWLDKLIIAKDKTMVQGHVLIDDRPNVKGAMSNPSWEHVVFTACHNIRTNIHGKRRLDNWTDGQWRQLLDDIRKKI